MEPLKTTESDEQISLFRWAQIASSVKPELKLMFHVPNEGKRTRYSGGKLIAEGLKPGVPDVCLPVPNKKYHGLFIEMKKPRGGVVSDNQKACMEMLSNNGYCVTVCHGFIEAKTAITAYLDSCLVDKKGTPL